LASLEATRTNPNVFVDPIRKYEVPAFRALGLGVTGVRPGHGSSLRNQQVESESRVTEKISFLATRAGQNSSAKWLTLDSDVAARIVFEAPSSELAPVMTLATKTKALIRVTVEDA
jgi:hypothetical protein